MVRSCVLILVSVLLVGSPAFADEVDVKLPDPEKFHLFLLVGQSNMAGRGKVTPADQTAHPRVLKFNKDGQWVPATDPLHFDKPRAVGVGLGKTFAETLAEADPEVTIGLIPCAVGGSPISVWVPGAYYKPTKSHPYDDTIKRCQFALPAGTLKGILWHQGESDSKPDLVGVYADRLEELIERLRRELNAPEVPFIAGQMGQFADVPWSDGKTAIDAIHRALPDSIPQTGFVSAKGLTHKGDRVHFDAKSYRELGRRYANKYLELTGQSADVIKD